MTQQSNLNKLITYRDYLNNKYYTEPPVDIIRFVEDPDFLGASFDNGKKFRPCWRKHLKEIFYDNDKYLVVLTGATGTGKTTAAYIGMAYVIYKILILKRPWDFFGLADSGKFAVAFFNLNKTLGMSKGFNTLQNTLIHSPWFKRHGVIRGREGMEKIYFDRIEYLLASPQAKGFGTVGTHIIAAVMDEVDSPLESENSRIKITQAYYSTVTRFKNRFVKNNKSISRFFLVSSKQDEMSFLNTFIDTMQKKSERMYIADVNKWDSEPKETYSGNWFFVSCGDAYNPPKILRATEDARGNLVGQDEIDQFKMNGFNILRVPTEYLEDFELDMTTSLRDIAGVAIAGMRKSKLFPSEKMLLEAYDTNRDNPVTQPLILLGLKDPLRLIDFLDMSKFDIGKTIPRYIHCDIAFSGDALGLSMACINGYTQKEQAQEDGTYRMVNVPIAHTDFVMRIKARDGDVIPIHKIREFILDLRKAGFMIVRYTSDLRLASEDTLQLLNKAGVKAEYFSVDKPIDHYIDFRNLVFEKRWNCFKHQHLHLEMKNLEVDRDKGKIDHPKQMQDFERTTEGDLQEVDMEGSKDLSDAVVGAVINAIKDQKPPIDLVKMEKLVQQVQDQSQSRSREEATIDKLMQVGPGKQAIGTVGGASTAINKFGDMLKKL